MNSTALILRAAALFSLCAILSAAQFDPNQAATAAVPGSTNLAQPAAVQPQTVQVVVPELDQLRGQLRDMERSNEEMRKSSEQAQKASEQASQKFEHMSQQNSALSNVLIGLQQTLIAQREREVELAKQSTSFQFKVILGSAAAVFLVLLFSYWFQLRCLNRVMEIKTGGLLPAGGRSPHLLEAENPQTSKLLSAMKMLEHRMEQLETPGQHAAAAPTLVDSAGVEPSTSSSMSLLLAKGQVLLDTERLQEAVACFQEAITVDPENSEAHLKKGIALERMGRMEQALAAYEEALRLNPKRTVANVYKARVLAAMHRYDEAISTYDNALGRNSAKVETPIFAS